MIEKIEIRTQFGKMLTLLLQNSTNGLFIKDLDGLDPTKSNIVTTSFAKRDGTQRQASRRESRTLKIKLGFDPTFETGTVELLRRELYKFFMTKMLVDVRYYTAAGLVVEVTGEVEEFVSPRMVQDPEANIQIFCFDSDFREITPRLVSSESVEGTVETVAPAVLDYGGSVDTGFIFRMNVTRQLDEFTFVNLTEDGIYREMEFRAELWPNDVLEISTITGEKGAWVSNSGGRLSYLDAISPYSDWVHLFQGENRLFLLMEGEPHDYTIEYSEKYGGI